MYRQRLWACVPALSRPPGAGRRAARYTKYRRRHAFDVLERRMMLAANLTDGEGFLWDLQDNQSVLNGTIDAYDGGHALQGFVGSASPGFEDGGREVVVGPESLGGVEVTRKVYVPTTQGFARYLEIVTNNTAATTNFTVRIDTNLGSDGFGEFVNTSDGDTTFETFDNWIITDDTDGTDDPTIVHVVSGSGGVDPTTTSYTPGFLTYTYDLTLAPGETQIVMHFGAQSSNRALARNQAANLAALGLFNTDPFGALAGMSLGEMAQVVNYNLTINLTDGEGFLWDLQTSGAVLNGTIDAYDSGHALQGFANTNNAASEDGGREIVFGPESLSGVEVTRKVYVPTTQGFARYLEIVTNNTAATTNFTVRIETNLGSDGFGEFINTSDSDTTFEPTDNWIITDDADGTGDPTVLHVIGGSLGGVDATTSYTPGFLTYTYDLTLAPGETQIVMHFGAQSSNRAAAQSKVAQFQALDFGSTDPLGALVGMTSEERARVMNYRLGIPGDYDRDTDVDNADYSVWRAAFGQAGIGLPADGNNNNGVDAADYVVWRKNFGSSFGGGSSAPFVQSTTIDDAAPKSSISAGVADVVFNGLAFEPGFTPPRSGNFTPHDFDNTPPLRLIGEQKTVDLLLSLRFSQPSSDDDTPPTQESSVDISSADGAASPTELLEVLADSARPGW